MNKNVRIFAKTIDENARKQIDALASNPSFEGAQIRMMPDTHAGAGVPVGFTATGMKRVLPDIIGVDIGCGIDGFRIPIAPEDEPEIDFKALDEVIRKNVPSGFNRHKDREALGVFIDELWAASSEGFNFHRLSEFAHKISGGVFDDAEADERSHKFYENFLQSIGTLGGGNHFIEVDKDSEGYYWLLVHSGSRNLGLQVHKYHRERAKRLNEAFGCDVNADGYVPFFPYNLIEDEDAIIEMAIEYLQDMAMAQDYAYRNRSAIAQAIFRNADRWLSAKNYVDGERVKMSGGFNIRGLQQIRTTHNYRAQDGTIRKGAISAQDGEMVLIPINMRDGVIIARGNANAEWGGRQSNFSMPHGAGRILSRTAAKNQLNVEDFKNDMEGVASWSISKGTLDESPRAYKGIDEILGVVEKMGDVVDVMKPVFNFKAS